MGVHCPELTKTLQAQVHGQLGLTANVLFVTSLLLRKIVSQRLSHAAMCLKCLEYSIKNFGPSHWEVFRHTLDDQPSWSVSRAAGYPWLRVVIWQATVS